MQLRPHSDVLISKYLFISEIMTTQSEIFIKGDASNNNKIHISISIMIVKCPLIDNLLEVTTTALIAL